MSKGMKEWVEGRAPVPTEEGRKNKNEKGRLRGHVLQKEPGLAD